MARERRRAAQRPVTVYDNDATLITAVPSEEPIEPVRSASVGMAGCVDIPLVDVIDSLASYSSVGTLYAEEKADKAGKCLLCGDKTNYKFRKICVNCMKKYGNEIYDLAREATDNGHTAITLDLVD